MKFEIHCNLKPLFFSSPISLFKTSSWGIDQTSSNRGGVGVDRKLKESGRKLYLCQVTNFIFDSRSCGVGWNRGKRPSLGDLWEKQQAGSTESL